MLQTSHCVCAVTSGCPSNACAPPPAGSNPQTAVPASQTLVSQTATSEIWHCGPTTVWHRMSVVGHLTTRDTHLTAVSNWHSRGKRVKQLVTKRDWQEMLTVGGGQAKVGSGKAPKPFAPLLLGSRILRSCFYSRCGSALAGREVWRGAPGGGPRA